MTAAGEPDAIGDLVDGQCIAFLEQMSRTLHANVFDKAHWCTIESGGKPLSKGGPAHGGHLGQGFHGVVRRRVLKDPIQREGQTWIRKRAEPGDLINAILGQPAKHLDETLAHES